MNDVIMTLCMDDTQQPTPRVNFWKRHAPVLEHAVDVQRVEIFGLGLAALGAVVVFFYSGLSRATASWMLSAEAFFAVGMTAGFIFAIPKASGQCVNSNLELISDWLTKILVGVGLTQFRSIPTELRKLAIFAAGGSGSSDQNHAFALFVILYFFFGGFVAAYLETRVVLTGAFIRSQPAEEKSSVKDRSQD
jgi:hypothetical protein